MFSFKILHSSTAATFFLFFCVLILFFRGNGGRRGQFTRYGSAIVPSVVESHDLEWSAKLERDLLLWVPLYLYLFREGRDKRDEGTLLVCLPRRETGTARIPETFP